MSRPSKILDSRGNQCDWFANERNDDAERRWEASQSNRLNSYQWVDATGNSINVDLSLYGDELGKRCELEAGRNPFVEGVINTHITDVVGPAPYPILEVLTEEDGFNEDAIEVWNEFWALPDINSKWSGNDFLQCDLRMAWLRGDFLHQKIGVSERGLDPNFPVSLRLHNIHPRRLVSPSGHANANIHRGVEVNRLGKPVRYWIREYDSDDAGYNSFIAGSFNPKEVDAKSIIHEFRLMEPGQVRGVPWLATCLQSTADLRDYDAQVLDAARAAADYAVVLTTTDPTLLSFQFETDAAKAAASHPGQTAIQRRTIRAMPPGWVANQLDPKQPTMNYCDYRGERLREVGRPVSMPLMMVKLDAANHSYSSARFDAQVYQSGNAVIQAWFEQMLNRLFDEVMREAFLAGMFDGRRKMPRRIARMWTWPVPPHVDPSKEERGNDIAIQNGSMTVSEVVPGRMLTMRQHEAMLKKDKRLRDLGLIPPLTSQQKQDALTASDLPDPNDPAAARSFISRYLRQPIVRDAIRDEVEDAMEELQGTLAR